MKRDRATWLDALKCLLIMFVVLGHALQWTIDPDCHSLMLKFIRSVQMPLFVFISGYLFREGYNGNEIVSKVMRLLIPFFAWGLIKISMKCLLNPMFGFFDGIVKLFLNPQSGLWFFWTLSFDMMIVFGVELISMKLRINHFIFAFILCVVAFVSINGSGAKMFGIHQIVYYLPYFLLGRLCSKYKFNGNKTSRRNWTVLVLLCLVAWAAMACFYEWKGLIQLPFSVQLSGALAEGFRMFCAFCGAVGLFGLIQLNKRNKVFQFKMIMYIGRNTFGIYAVHCAIWSIFNWQGFPSSLLFILLIISSVVAIEMLQRNRWTAYMFLGKKAR